MGVALMPGKYPHSQPACLPAGHFPHPVLGLVFQVTMPGEPVEMACGVDHMVTLAKSFI